MADARSSEDASPDDDERRVERPIDEEYDFEEFGPAEMDRMSPEEWEAAFDPDSWITGVELLDRVEADLKGRIASRDVFAVLERFEGDTTALLAYSDEGYAIVYPDGSIEGEGTVLRDVKPSVALCSMDDYEVAEPPADWSLPDPEEVPEGSGDLGNKMLQLVAFGLLTAGVIAIGGAVLGAGGNAGVVVVLVGGVFLIVSVFLFLVVANARLSDRFRAVEYKNRLRSAGVRSADRPDFVPVENGELVPRAEGRERSE
ncbi:DUF7319 domain-containing protein [Halalkalicoccus salilacus]|uniref:DUF7319 domain-containing protein n=1 Tax=Halalkalicoccus TaxID=332246 RepID=UPI002F967212